MAKPAPKTIIGRYDKIDLPQMELVDIDAKIDTGADGSAIHCHHIELVKKKGGKAASLYLAGSQSPRL